jgi:hypothetical protein
MKQVIGMDILVDNDTGLEIHINEEYGVHEITMVLIIDTDIYVS